MCGVNRSGFLRFFCSSRPFPSGRRAARDRSAPESASKNAEDPENPREEPDSHPSSFSNDSDGSDRSGCGPSVLCEGFGRLGGYARRIDGAQEGEVFLVLIEHVVDDLFATPAHEVVVAASFAKEDFGRG